MLEKRYADVQGSGMEMLLFLPEGKGPFPGIVVAQHIPVAHTGLEKDPFQLKVGERLAQAGFAAVIPYIFHWWAPEEDIAVKREEFRDDRVIEDLAAAYDLLAGSASVDGNRIGIIGHCWGGRVSWLGACSNPGYKAVTILYGGRIKVGMGEGATAPIKLADKINCPVLGIFGNDDQNPSPEDVNDYERALAEAGVHYEFHRYDDAGHGFQDFTNPERYRKEAAEDAWRKVLAFNEKELTSDRST